MHSHIMRLLWPQTSMHCAVSFARIEIQSAWYITTMGFGDACMCVCMRVFCLFIAFTLSLFGRCFGEFCIGIECILFTAECFMRKRLCVFFFFFSCFFSSLVFALVRYRLGTPPLNTVEAFFGDMAIYNYQRIKQTFAKNTNTRVFSCYFCSTAALFWFFFFFFIPSPRRAYGVFFLLVFFHFLLACLTNITRCMHSRNVCADCVVFFFALLFICLLYLHRLRHLNIMFVSIVKSAYIAFLALQLFTFELVRVQLQLCSRCQNRSKHIV